MEITTFYFPGWRGTLKMANDESDDSGSDGSSESAEEEKVSDNPLVDFVGSDADEMHCEIIFESIQTDVILEPADSPPQLILENELEKAVITKSSPMLRIRKESIPADLKSKIVMNWIYMNKKKLEVVEQIGMSLQTIDNVLYEFKILRDHQERLENL